MDIEWTMVLEVRRFEGILFIEWTMVLEVTLMDNGIRSWEI